MASIRSGRPLCAPSRLKSLFFFPCCLVNSSSVDLIDDGTFLSFQRGLSSVSSLYASLPQEIDGVMSLALCLQVMSSSSSTLPRRKLLVFVAFPARLSARSFLPTSACPSEYIHRSARRWMSNTVSC